MWCRMKRSNVCLVASSLDPASMNMVENLIGLANCETIRRTNQYEIYSCEEIRSPMLIVRSDLIHLKELPPINPAPSRLVFLSRHSSASKTLSLLMHFTGNWTNNNEYGGQPKSLGLSDPLLGKIIFLELNNKVSELGFDGIPISLEATHHGPTELDKPLIFVEIGSDLDAWRNRELGHLWAVTIIDAIKKIDNGDLLSRYEVALGFGGPHYAPNFTEIEKKTHIALSHIAPKHVVDNLDADLLSQAVERSANPPKLAILDWKGLNSNQRNKIQTLLEEFTDLEIVRARKLLRKI